MLEPLAASVRHSVLPTRPLVSHLLVSASAAGMLARSASHPLVSDFFTPHPRRVDKKGKGRALPDEADEVCSTALPPTWMLPEGGRTTRHPAPCPARPRARRSSYHKPIASGSRAHLHSVSHWTTQFEVPQRRHASSGTAVQVSESRRPPSSRDTSPLNRVILPFIYRDDPGSPDDAWKVYRACRDPLHWSLAHKFIAKLINEVTRDPHGTLSPTVLRLWGERIQDALYHIDPGIPTTDAAQARWHGLHVCVAAMQGQLAGAMDGARHILDLAGDDETRLAQALNVYTVLTRCLHQYAGPEAVLDFLLQDGDLVGRFFLSNSYDLPGFLRTVAPRFTHAISELLGSFHDSVGWHQRALQEWTGTQAALGTVVLLRSLIRSERPQEALAILRTALSASLSIPSSTALTLVRALTHAKDYDDAAQVLAILPEPGLEHSKQLYADYHRHALYLHSRTGDAASANRHFDALAQASLITPQLQGNLMHTYAVIGDVTTIVQLFNRFFHNSSTDDVKERPRPDLIHYTTVIHAHARAGDIEGVNTWLKRLSDAGLKPGLHIYSIVLQGFALKGDHSSMTKLLDKMRDNGVTPNCAICTTVITTLGTKRDSAGAEQLYNRAVAEGVVPDSLMTVALMNAQIESGAWKNALRTYDEERNRGQPLNINTFNALLKANMSQLNGTHVRPNSHTFALLIRSACDAGNAHMAVQLHDQMLRMSEQGRLEFRPNIYVFTNLLKSYLSKGKTRMAQWGPRPAKGFLDSLVDDPRKEDWLQTVGKRRHNLDLIYSPLLRANVERMWHRDAQKLHDEMLSKHGRPTIGTLTLLLDVYRNTRNIDAVELVWPEIRRLADGLARESAALLQSTAMSRAGRHAAVARAWKDAQDAGAVFDSHNWNHLVIALVRAGEHARAFGIVEHVLLRHRRHRSHDEWDAPQQQLAAGEEPEPAPEDAVVAAPEAPLRRVARRAAAQKIGRKHMRQDVRLRAALLDDEHHHHDFDADEDAGGRTADVAKSLRFLADFGLVWDVWRPHRVTLTLLARALLRLRSGVPVPALPPDQVRARSQFDFVSYDRGVKERVGLEGRMASREAAKKLAREIEEQFPEAARLATKYAERFQASKRRTGVENR
ncbi:uncharacterized protein BXZ73DRAFT_74237 [Epithele typhae]|uniref:uncharacterized protein n=1 Tax=Epithele typhae TaxID=378194 RepID=UPI002008C0D0|nr:uncharacterized protein BXZ73DRAFT_74237 [Epithele typhae]KAH9943237.1 hypothetical protein BXZ73DRAFT_74237 [Epithele typhae]